ncbi:gustatory receptor for sugar taste 43a-like [Melanaphis sacchari]|uniref:gustatory receptor for sugar taste 43a-like n=1 Tax=Melanaphis sacchari TaxID=742174 RepID=UPI000DC12D90|nr:gustatory receptor for sugar taste 43a-like [Melanaphis sacchari]
MSILVPIAIPLYLPITYSHIIPSTATTAVIVIVCSVLICRTRSFTFVFRDTVKSNHTPANHHVMYDFSKVLLRVWQCLLIAPVTLRWKPAGGNAQRRRSHYAFNAWWYAFNLAVLAACVAGGMWTVAEDARAFTAGRSMRIQNTSSAVVTTLQVTLQCLVCTLAVACSAGRHVMLLDIERHLNRTDAVFRVSADQPLARYTPTLVAFHAALFAVDGYLWYALSPATWMYCVCYVYMFIDLATMLMYAQVAWNIGRRFEDINAAIEYKLAGIQSNVTAAAFDRGFRGNNGCRPPQRVWTFAGHTAVVVSPDPVPPADCRYDPKNISIAKLQDLHWSLCNSIKIVNDKFGWQLFLQLFCNCVQLIVTPYFMIINLFYPVVYGSTDIKFILIQVVWVLTHLSHLLLIVLPTSYATRKGEKTAEIICKYLTIDIEPGDMKQLEIFVLQLQKYAIDFSACGIVNLHRSTITTIIGTALTYLVILIQFQNSD